MLREIRKHRQIPGEAPRRWFHSPDMDLIVWLRSEGEGEGEIAGFQLCYDKARGEKALTWKADRGFTHMAVDDGEALPGYKMTPLLVPDGAFDSGTVRRRFSAAAQALPDALRSFIETKLAQASPPPTALFPPPEPDQPC